MRPNFILVDLESVQPVSLDALAAEHFRLKVFVGANQAKMPFEFVAAIQRMGNRAEYIKIAGTGPNALDFHIAYYIGRITCDHPDAFIHIISKDSGFDPLVRHLKDLKIFCARWPSVDDIPAAKAAATTSPEGRARVFAAALMRPKATRPRTEKTLRSAISAYFKSQLSEADVHTVIGAMLESRQISILDGKVSYLFTLTPP